MKYLEICDIVRRLDVGFALRVRLTWGMGTLDSTASATLQPRKTPCAACASQALILVWQSLKIRTKPGTNNMFKS